ncbi:MAG: nucleotide sugar dehydrogenase [Candidatus Abyssobacteria bacterium SURF_5]|uniref:Nucleotide sugar dehydrogenase n=1 Tax=Abyssobacteria bacterium (strain SURF_5) TaxID=2093360 RepID=A0A3A4NPH8_ABYX5|nr:MAG: nucleotide sugar dehydrogenase [Candidatus Abyssubacteria bacterium SURF_5]
MQSGNSSSRNNRKKKASTAASRKLGAQIESKQALIGVIGMGYVGLPLALEFCRSGFRVMGFDIDQTKVDALNAGKSYIGHIPSANVKSFSRAGLFSATSDFSRLAEPDCISICVPTPLNQQKEPDLKYVAATSEAISERLRPGQLVVLESTTYPGTTEELMLPILSRSKLAAGRDFFLAYSPEREDPGNRMFPIEKIPKVVGGISPKCSELAGKLYAKIFERVVPVSSTGAAEMTKLLENIFRCVNIALVNEMKMLAERMGIDIWEVIEAASSKPFGFMPFYPGPGLGGHCIPIDPFYLSWKAREYDFNTRFIELAGEVNTFVPYHVVQRIGEALNLKGKSIRGARILVLGVAYKPDVDDMRESPAIKIIELLLKQGADVRYNDPHIPRFPRLRKYDLDMVSVKLTPRLMKSMDCVAIITNHSSYDYNYIVKHAPMVIDTRNATKAVTNSKSKIIKA